MKKVLLLFGFFTLFGCNEPNVNRKDTDLVVFYGASSIEVITIDSCQYLLGDWGSATVLTHKGNCKNHKQN
jgi:hypothetical protein